MTTETEKPDSICSLCTLGASSGEVLSVGHDGCTYCAHCLPAPPQSLEALLARYNGSGA